MELDDSLNDSSASDSRSTGSRRAPAVSSNISQSPNQPNGRLKSPVKSFIGINTLLTAPAVIPSVKDASSSLSLSPLPPASKKGVPNRRETADPGDLLALLGSLDDEDDNNYRPENSEPAPVKRNAAARESIDTVALNRSVDYLLRGGDNRTPSSSNDAPQTSFEVSPLSPGAGFGRSSLSPAASPTRSDGGSVAPLTQSALATHNRLTGLAQPYALRPVSSSPPRPPRGPAPLMVAASVLAGDDALNRSSASQATVDVIASIDSMLAPHRPPGQKLSPVRVSSGGKTPISPYLVVIILPSYLLL